MNKKKLVFIYAFSWILDAAIAISSGIKPALLGLLIGALVEKSLAAFVIAAVLIGLEVVEFGLAWYRDNMQNQAWVRLTLELVRPQEGRKGLGLKSRTLSRYLDFWEAQVGQLIQTIVRMFVVPVSMATAYGLIPATVVLIPLLPVIIMAAISKDIYIKWSARATRARNLVDARLDAGKVRHLPRMLNCLVTLYVARIKSKEGSVAVTSIITVMAMLLAGLIARDAATIAAVVMAVRAMDSNACELAYGLFGALENKGVEKEFNAMINE